MNFKSFSWITALCLFLVPFTACEKEPLEAEIDGGGKQGAFEQPVFGIDKCIIANKTRGSLGLFVKNFIVGNGTVGELFFLKNDLNVESEVISVDVDVVYNFPVNDVCWDSEISNYSGQIGLDEGGVIPNCFIFSLPACSKSYRVDIKVNVVYEEKNTEFLNVYRLSFYTQQTLNTYDIIGNNIYACLNTTNNLCLNTTTLSPNEQAGISGNHPGQGGSGTQFLQVIPESNKDYILAEYIYGNN